MAESLPLSERPQQRPALIIFDWDDTLVDNYAAIHAAINAARAHFNKPVWSLEETRLKCRTALHEIFPYWFGDAWMQARDVFYRVFSEEHIAHLRIKPGAPELLAAITHVGIPVAVNSNKSSDFLRQEVAHLGWDSYFSVLVGAGDVPRGKPAPDGVHHIRQILALSASSPTWFVGDNDMDVQTARAGGCLPILLQPHKENEGVREGVVFVNNCHEMLDFFHTVA